MRVYCEVYAHLYVVSTVLAMVYMKHANHLATRERNGWHFVYSKLIYSEEALQQMTRVSKVCLQVYIVHGMRRQA